MAVLEGSAEEVALHTGLTPAELVEAVHPYDALIVRSESKVTREVLEAGPNLKVVGRAGVGVDNIDVEAATERGIVVINAPEGNTVSAAELAVALLLAVSRHIASADASLRRGEWNRKAFIGSEIRGKTAGLIGLGQVGSTVARRLRAMEMRVLAFDPFVPAERAEMLDVELVDLPHLLRLSDYVSLHCALTPETKHLIGRDELALMKPGSRLINTARGGLVDESALREVLDSDRIAGAALDVFEQEPAGGNPLLQHPKIVATPHLGASTVEAQGKVAMSIARQVLDVLEGRPASTAVNAPFVDPETVVAISPYLEVAEMCGVVATQLAEGGWREVCIDYLGDLANYDVTPLKAAAVKGLLSFISEEGVNLVSMPQVLARRGWQVRERKETDAGPYTSLLSIRLHCARREVTVAGTLIHGTPHLVRINGFEVDVSRGTLGKGRGHILIVENEDRPGRVGAVGTALGGMDINISHMAVGRRDPNESIMVLSIHRGLEPEELNEVGFIPGVVKVVQVRI
jgi:D-3-phosphoglycerate dehydrogenase